MKKVLGKWCSRGAKSIGGIFTVNGQRVKHYHAGDPISDHDTFSEDVELRQASLDSGQTT